MSILLLAGTPKRPYTMQLQINIWLLLLVIPATVMTASLSLVDQCEPARQAGVDFTTFSEIVAHNMHSLSVEDINYFFDEKFPINNTLPTVNFDLTGSPVLLFAPSRPSAFKFPGGAAVDFILSNNDQPNKFGASGLTNLEEIIHQMHMLEMWHMASKVYKDIKSKNIDIKEVCPCLVNEQENGILNELNRISKLFQNWITAPIVDGERRIPRRVARGVTFGHGYPPERNVKKGKRSTDQFDMVEETTKDEENVNLEDSSEKLVYQMINGEEYQIIPELKDSKTWNTYWKSKLFVPESKEVKEQNMFNFAMYMFCKINYA